MRYDVDPEAFREKMRGNDPRTRSSARKVGGCDISDCRTFESLPAAAQAYVREMERLSGCRIGYVSVGAGREQYIVCE